MKLSLSILALLPVLSSAWICNEPSSSSVGTTPFCCKVSGQSLSNTLYLGEACTSDPTRKACVVDIGNMRAACCTELNGTGATLCITPMRDLEDPNCAKDQHVDENGKCACSYPTTLINGTCRCPGDKEERGGECRCPPHTHEMGNDKCQ